MAKSPTVTEKTEKVEETKKVERKPNHRVEYEIKRGKADMEATAKEVAAMERGEA